MNIDRRYFFKQAAVAMMGAGTAPLWLARTTFGASTSSRTGPASRKKILVAIFQRGAVDGLNVVVPHGESRYYDLRPNIAIAQPGKDQGVLDLDGHFGLHPALAPLKPLFDARELAIVHAAGSPDPTRSHFDAQDFMESGTPGNKGTEDGWLNRAIAGGKGQPTGKNASPLRAVGVGPTLARTLRGKEEATAITTLADFQVRGAQGEAAFQRMYDKTHDATLHDAGRETFDAVKRIQAIQKQPYLPANGAKYPQQRLGPALKEIARLIKADVGMEAAFAEMPGWDTHVNETTTLNNLLTQYGQALAAFRADLGGLMENVVVVTMSEFGRTAKENGTRGTDHGHANAMFVMGGPVLGGRVLGQWPGLAADQLYEGRDLAVTTDFRDVLGAVIARQTGNSNLHKVFPGYMGSPMSGLLRA